MAAGRTSDQQCRPGAAFRLCRAPTASLSAATALRLVYSDTAAARRRRHRHTALASTADLPYGTSALEQHSESPSPLKLPHLLHRRSAQAEVPPLLAPCRRSLACEVVPAASRHLEEGKPPRGRPLHFQPQAHLPVSVFLVRLPPGARHYRVRLTCASEPRCSAATSN